MTETFIILSVLIGICAIGFCIGWRFFKNRYGKYVFRTFLLPLIIINAIVIGCSVIFGLFDYQLLFLVSLIYVIPLYILNTIYYFIIKWIKRKELETEKKQLVNANVPKLTEGYTKVQVIYTTLINKCFNEVMAQKGKDELFTLTDASNITTALLATVNVDYGDIPPQFKAACDESLAIVAPSTLEKKKYKKTAVGVVGGVIGIGMIIGALGTVLGWGAGVLASIKAFFVGVSLTGPIALIIGGLTVAGIATYYAFAKPDNATLAQKFKETRIKQTEESVEATWDKYKYKFE